MNLLEVLYDILEVFEAGRAPETVSCHAADVQGRCGFQICHLCVVDRTEVLFAIDGWVTQNNTKTLFIGCSLCWCEKQAVDFRPVRRSGIAENVRALEVPGKGGRGHRMGDFLKPKAILLKLVVLDDWHQALLHHLSEDLRVVGVATNQNTRLELLQHK